MQLARRAAGLKAVSYPILAVGPEDAQGYCLAVGLRAGRLPDAPQVSEVLCVCVTTVSRGWPKPRPAPKPYSVHDRDTPILPPWWPPVWGGVTANVGTVPHDTPD
jgi:hypothetical protein